VHYSYIYIETGLRKHSRNEDKYREHNMLFDACVYPAVHDEPQYDKIERTHQIPRGALYFMG
jgi:hypothetical protein